MIDLNGKKIVDLTVELIARVTRLMEQLKRGQLIIMDMVGRVKRP